MTWQAGTDTDLRLRKEWAEAKGRQLASGYVTEYDRRTLRELRARETRGFVLTEAQLDFCERVERALTPWSRQEVAE